MVGDEERDAWDAAVAETRSVESSRLSRDPVASLRRDSESMYIKYVFNERVHYACVYTLIFRSCMSQVIGTDISTQSACDPPTYK